MTTTEPEVTDPGTGDEPDTDETPEEDVPFGEPDEPDGDTDPEPEPEPQSEPAAHGEAWWEKAFKASEREDERHAARVGAIFEEEANDFARCPMCLHGPAGFLTSPPDDPGQLALIDHVLGRQNPDDFEAGPGYAECQTCKGRGQIRTNSKVEAYKLVSCTSCGGHGYNIVPPPGAQVIPMPPTVTAGGAAETPTQPAQEYPDAWGRTVGHPHYGVPPADIGV